MDVAKPNYCVDTSPAAVRRAADRDSKFAARRSRPASAWALSGQVSDLAIRSPASSARAPRSPTRGSPGHSAKPLHTTASCQLDTR